MMNETELRLLLACFVQILEGCPGFNREECLKQAKRELGWS